MVACVLARGCVRALVCALAMGAAEVAAQEAPAKSEETSQTQSQPEPPVEPAKTPEPAPPAAKPEEKAHTATGASTLPGMMVDAPKVTTTKKKVTGKTTAAAPAGGGDEPAPEVPGIIYGQALSDTGTTTFDSKNVNLRTDGSGDANTFLRNLPNVQYQDDTNEDAGASSAKAVDTRPLLLSISGARTYENNIILNGVSISNITGAVDGNSPESLTDYELTPNSYGVYGLHPQTVFVPTEFVGQATLIESNASAEYGQFQGGVVIYDLAAPPTDRYHASVSFSRETSDMVNYILGTEDGININNRVPPQFERNNLAVSVGAPITSDFAFIAQASRKEAEASKQQVYYIGDDFVEENSDNIFLRFAATARTDIGKFTLDVSRTDYFQHWENPYGRDLNIDTTTESTSSQVKYETDLAGVRVDSIGLGRTKLKSTAFYNSSETLNNSGDNITFMWYNQRLTGYKAGVGWTEAYDTTLHDDWCKGVDPVTQPSTAGGLFNCREGGYGNKLQGQTDYGVQATLDGDLLLGNFKVGTEIKQYEGRRARFEDYYFVSVNTIATSSNVSGGKFKCAADDRMCDEEQYASRYSVFEKYDVSAKVAALHSFAEIDQTWEWFNVRAGVRMDYDDYQENVNLAPRLAGTVTLFDGVSVTGGYNRYYLGETLYYAIRDKQPRGYTVARTHTYADGEPYISSTPTGQYIRYQASGLDTPYSDEYTAAIRIRDPLLGGQLRLKYLERESRDQFESADCVMAGVTQCYTLTNDGWRDYRSASAEYTKEWNHLNTPFYLTAAAISGQVTWSEQTASRGTYLDDEEDLDGDGVIDNPIWYNDASYTRTGFTAVTGNLDIPVRFGATLATVWFDNMLQFNLSAGVNLGYEGVYDTGRNITPDGYTTVHDEYADKKFGATLQLDASGQINVTEQAMIEFHVNNITNSTGNAVASHDNPWLMGRSYYVGTALRF